MDLEENMFLFATLSYLHLTEIRPVYALNCVTMRKTNIHNWPTIRTHIQCATIGVDLAGILGELVPRVPSRDLRP